MSNIISIGNHKGGVGKTTSAINIGAGLKQLHKTILLIDLDPQANLTMSLGIKNPIKTIYDGLRNFSCLSPVTVDENIDVIPSSIELASAEIELSMEAGREYILSEYLSSIKDKYDYILIDCPPSLGLLTLNALTASKYVLIPMQSQYLSMQGLSKFIDIIGKVGSRLNKSIEIGGIFLTQYNSHKILNRNIAETLTKHFPNKLFSTKIRDNISLAEAPTAGLDIFRYASSSNGAIDYLNLCKELLDLNKKAKAEKICQMH